MSTVQYRAALLTLCPYKGTTFLKILYLFISMVYNKMPCIFQGAVPLDPCFRDLAS